MFMHPMITFSLQELNQGLSDWWTDNSRLSPEQQDTLKTGGYYSITVQEGLRVISYNSLYRYNIFMMFTRLHQYKEIIVLLQCSLELINRTSKLLLLLEMISL